MEKQILEILKQKDDWKFTVEIKENAKGEAQVFVKTRSDRTAKEAGDEALKEYNRIKKELQEAETRQEWLNYAHTAMMTSGIWII